MALALVVSCFCAEAAELSVTVKGVASSVGTLMLGLYDTEDHFKLAIADAAKLGLVNNPSRLVGIAMRAVAGIQSAVFTNLEPGTYAVIVFHDADDDGTLDEGLLGLPRRVTDSATMPKDSSRRLPSRPLGCCLAVATDRSS